MKKIFIIYFFTSLCALGNTYSMAGIDSKKNMKFLMEETGVEVFQIDIPWRDYHLGAVISEAGVENTFAELEKLDSTLEEIRGIGGRVIIQLSIHYIPQWFLDSHRDKLLRNYRGGFEIQSEDLEKHLIPSPYSDLVKYEIIGAWYDYMGRYLRENYNDIIEYINPGILEEGQMSYPWSGYDGDELVFWAFDRAALEGYRTYLERIFSLNTEDTGRTPEKLERINEKYGTHFLQWSEVRPPQTFYEVGYYNLDDRGKSNYLMDFMEFYAEGPLSAAKLYSDVLLQYFPREKLAIKIPHWHRGGQNKRTFAEGRFIDYYMQDLKSHYGALIFLPVQDLDSLTRYIKRAKSMGYKVLLEPTIKVGDWREMERVLEIVEIDGINAVNAEDFLGESGREYRRAYREWLNRMKKDITGTQSKESALY